jgi:hypothetical protein
MKRKDLESFLLDSGLGVGRSAFFHPGLLNKIYVRFLLPLPSACSRN